MSTGIEGLGVGAAFLGAGLIALSLVFLIAGGIRLFRQRVLKREVKPSKAFPQALTFFIAGVVLIIIAYFTGALSR